MLLATREKRVGIWRTIFYLPALDTAGRRDPRFQSSSSTRRPRPVNTILGHLGIQGPLWFPGSGVVEAVTDLLGLWGGREHMVIFLAAVLDVPRHLYESAELDGAGPLQRLRWVTLPTTSPVILFAASSV